MTERTKKHFSRTGLAILLLALPIGVATAIALGDRPPAWVYVIFGAGVLITAIPGFFPTKPDQVRN